MGTGKIMKRSGGHVFMFAAGAIILLILLDGSNTSGSGSAFAIATASTSISISASTFVQVISTADAGRGGCNGTIWECSDHEFLMESEISRRILAQQPHISNEALKKDAAKKVPRGKPYTSKTTYHRPCPRSNGCDRPGSPR
ncbi:hypothetical protein ACLOJK_002504 [Asimina triloba]